MLAPRMGEFDRRELARVGNLLAQARFFWLHYHMIFSTSNYINNTHLGGSQNSSIDKVSERFSQKLASRSTGTSETFRSHIHFPMRIQRCAWQPSVT